MSNPKILTKGWDPIQPADAGWTYISFAVHTLSAGGTLALPADGEERALVPLSGIAEV
jgi:5-deoxy-glucuronate isomerase